LHQVSSVVSAALKGIVHGQTTAESARPHSKMRCYSPCQKPGCQE
jgi:hypothetical protein